MLKLWPKDRKQTVDPGELLKPLFKAAKFLYTLKRRNVGQDVPYNGYTLGSKTLAVSPNPKEALTAENLRNYWRGMKPFEVLLLLAFQMGVEQGRRDS